VDASARVAVDDPARAAGRPRRLRHRHVGARALAPPASRRPRRVRHPELRCRAEDDAHAPHAPGLDRPRRRLQPDRLPGRHRRVGGHGAAPRPRALAAVGGTGVNAFEVAALALLAGFVPLAWVALREREIDGVIALELAGTLTTLVLLCLAEVYHRGIYMSVA